MKKRIISAIIMVLIAAPFIFLGKTYFKIFILLLGEMALYEFFKFRKKIPLIIKILEYLILGGIILKDLIGINLETIIIINLFITLGSLVFLNNNYNYREAFFLMGLTIFLGLAFENIIFIRNLGLDRLIYILLITVATDSFALFIGKSIGKTKLAPSISPNKTIEGLVGGVLVGTIIAVVFHLIFIKEITNIPFIIIITIVLSLVGEYGDLIKSSIKRFEKVKDFSNLIPGHGGIMDRLDSLIFVGLLYKLVLMLGGFI